MNDFWNFPDVAATPERARIPKETVFFGERALLQCPVRIFIGSSPVPLSARHDRALNALFSEFECAETLFFHALCPTSNQDILDRLVSHANVGILLGLNAALSRLMVQSMSRAMQEQRLLFIRPSGPQCDQDDTQAVGAALSTIVILLDIPESHPAVIQGWEALRMNHAVWIPEMVLSIPELSWPRRMLAAGATRVSDTFTVQPVRGSLMG